MQKITLLVCMLSLIFFSSNAQEIVKLYEGASPGLKMGVTIKEEDISKENEIRRVRNVTEPTLTIYTPKNKTSDAAVIICPGGGYYILAIDHEGHDVAKWFAERGVTAFVLKYRLPQKELFDNSTIRPLQDAQQAIRLVRANAANYGISPNKIGIMGFSAGGHLASTASTHFVNQVGETADLSSNVRPDFSILLYPVISMQKEIVHAGSRQNLIGDDATEEMEILYSNDKQVTDQTPPTFIVHAFDDPVLVENSLLYATALKQHHIPTEVHLYDRGGHGFSLTKKQRGPVETWPDRLADWMKINGWMK